MRIIITVLGKDKSGIIAGVSSILAENQINIEDISQTIVSGNFTMIMVCNIENSKLSLQDLSQKLNSFGEKIGVSIHTQHEEIFNAMHTI